MTSILIRNAQLLENGPLVDISIHEGIIGEIGRNLKGEEAIEAKGGALIRGLADHHIHLLSYAARKASIDLEPVKTTRELEAAISSAINTVPSGAWIRCIGYHEQIAGDLTRTELDHLAPYNPIRVQHQTGSLWILNSAALDHVLDDGEIPDCVERDDDGVPTGRIWRGDDWLGKRMGNRILPDLSAAGKELSSFGITAVTDATPTTTATEAQILSRAHAAGALPQRLRLMSGGPLEADQDSNYTIGEVKILLDEHNLPAFEDIGHKIKFAFASDRAVAVHCVTGTELAFILAAFDAYGVPSGSRIEHGSVVPEAAIETIRAFGLTIVTQPSLIAKRGDRYLRDMPIEEHQDLYRCASFLRAGIRVAFSSDAPYGLIDPWLTIRTAMERKTTGGQTFSPTEAVPARSALRMFGADAVHQDAEHPIAPGMAADLCLLGASFADALKEPSRELVRATFIGGEIVYLSKTDF